MKKLYILSLTLILGVFVNNSAFATNYYLLSAGVGQPNNLSEWTTDPTGAVAVGTPTTFANAGDIWNIQNRATVSLTGAWILTATSTVVIGSGSAAITQSVSGLFGEIRNAVINANALGTLVISNGKTYNLTTLNAASTVVYNSSSAILKSVTYGNLTIAVTNTVLTSATGVDVNGTLTINASQNLILNGNILNINGAIAGTGTIKGDAAATLNFYTGTGGNAGTLNFAAGSNTLSVFYVQYSSSASSITLGSDLTVNTAFFQSLGRVDLGGKTLTIPSTGDASFSSTGGIAGSANSSLILNGTIGGNNPSSLFMVAGSNTLKVLAINSASPLTLGNALNITDSLSISGSAVTTGGFLTLKSTSALKGRIAEIKAGGSLSGNITVEMFVPGGVAGWRNLGAPGINGLTIGSWDGGSGSSTAFAMTCATCIYNSTSAGGYFVSVQGDPTGTGAYTELTTASAITPGTGVWLYDGNSTTTSIDVTLTKTGSPVTGAVASGTVFMANPYPSPISIDRLKTHTAITQVDLYNENTGTYTSYNGGIPASGVIPMGQAFYASGASNITFQESDKVAYNTSNNILRTASSSTIGTVFQLNVAGASSGDFDQTYIRFHNNATPNFDNALDAYKRFATPGYLGYPGAYSKYTTINTEASNLDYSINSLPYATTSNVVIPVKVRVSVTGTYSIIPVDIANLPSGSCVTLKDKLLNVTHDLRTGAYVCSINDTTSAARFELTICVDITAGISNLSANQNTTLINQDQNGAYVKTNFDTNTKATISAYNMMGQKLMADKEIEGKDLTTYLDLGDVHSQVVIIRVTTAKTNTTKKIFIN